jgi:uncharacterized protein (TIGR02147 family)
MLVSVFDYQNYKAYLESRLAGKGRKAQFAKYIGCQPSFLSQVLRGAPSLSLEQGVLANDFLQHSGPESRHFLALLQMERAGSKRLQAHFLSEVKASLAGQRQLAQRVGVAQEVSAAARARYYSSWIYAAVHVLSSIPAPGDQLEFLRTRTGLKADELDKVLRFLLEQGILSFEDGRYRVGSKRVHLPATDPLVLGHHRSFRARALRELEQPKSDSLHYSLLMGISRADAERLREIILKFVEGVDQVIRPSPEEAAYQLDLDFFEI